MEKWFYFLLDENVEGLRRCQVIILVIVVFVLHFCGVQEDGESDHDFDKLGATDFLNPTDRLPFRSLTLHADFEHYIMQRCSSQMVASTFSEIERIDEQIIDDLVIEVGV